MRYNGTPNTRCARAALALLLPGLVFAQSPPPPPESAPSVPASVAPAPAVPPQVAPPQLPVQELQSWRQRVRDAIQQHMVPPPSIPLDALVEVEVSLLPSGLAGDVTTRRASGHPDLDAALRSAVVLATPLPLPADPQRYERLRRFAVLYEARSGVRVVEARPLASDPQRQAFACRSPDVPAAPTCGAGGSHSDLLTCYAQALRAHTESTAAACGPSVYPLEARRNRREGTVHVGVNFEGGGQLGEVSVAQSSGHDVLDQRAVELVRESIVPPPPELLATAFVVQVPVVFQMQGSDMQRAVPAQASPDDAAPATTQAAPKKPAAKPKSATKKKPVKKKKKKKSTAKKRRV